MKALIFSAVSLVLGLGTGWLFGNSRAKHETTRVIEQLVQTTESSDASEVARDIRAIEWIGSGETERAVQLLSSRLAHYHYIYKPVDGRDEQRLRLRAAIEQLASTNSTVAAEMAKEVAR
jgi:hypothetical protein